MSNTFRASNIIRALNKNKWKTGYEGKLSKNFEILEVRPGWIKQRYFIEQNDVGLDNHLHPGIIASLM